MSAAPDLPSIGQKISCSISAASVPLEIGMLGLITPGLTGAFTAEVDSALSSSPGGVYLRVTSFEMTGSCPPVGTVTLGQADTDTTPLSLLEVTAGPAYRSTLFLDFTVSFQTPPHGCAGQLAGTETGTMLNDSLTEFPPSSPGALYRLYRPIDLAPADQPAHVMARLLELPSTVTGT